MYDFCVMPIMQTMKFNIILNKFVSNVNFSKKATANYLFNRTLCTFTHHRICVKEK